jgi:hypothetical protein
MNFSMTGQEKGDLSIQVTDRLLNTNRGMGRFDCTMYVCCVIHYCKYYNL